MNSTDIKTLQQHKELLLARGALQRDLIKLKLQRTTKPWVETRAWLEKQPVLKKTFFLIVPAFLAVPTLKASGLKQLLSLAVPARQGYQWWSKRKK